MDIQLLQEFVNLVETCSFQETADQMHISQSSLTKHVHKMEEELDVSFFDRSTRAVKLNDFSRAFYPYAREAVNAYEKGVVAINDVKRKDNSEIRVAFAPSLGQYDIVETISNFSKQYPEYPLKLMESYQIEHLVNEKRCDFAFMAEKESFDSRMNQLIYKTDHLVVVLNENHPLAKEPYLTLQQIKDENFILHADPMGRMQPETRKFMDVCQAENVEINVMANVTFTSTILKMISKEQGITVLFSYHAQQKETPGTVMIDFHPLVTTNIYCMYQSKRKSKSHQAFLNYIVSKIADEE